MAVANQVREILETGALGALRQLWAVLYPHLPQIGSDADAEIVLHRARTEAVSVSFRARAYSHAWLIERGHPSALPVELQPRAERMYPGVVEAIGVAVLSTSPELRPAGLEVQRAMLNVAGEMQADGVVDQLLIRTRMLEARTRVRRSLFGSTRMGAPA
jgi:hypothetical protein